LPSRNKISVSELTFQTIKNKAKLGLKYKCVYKNKSNSKYECIFE